ncbi:hypothetical protein QQ045_007412 [Rhodiola kirilowii]
MAEGLGDCDKKIDGQRRLKVEQRRRFMADEGQQSKNSTQFYVVTVNFRVWKLPELDLAAIRFMDPKTENNPYLGFIYTSFQERATFISHGNTARLAKDKGDLKLAQICGIIAADEKRHETAYTKIVEKLFELDPNGTIIALEDMMKKKITMPVIRNIRNIIFIVLYITFVAF